MINASYRGCSSDNGLGAGYEDVFIGMKCGGSGGSHAGKGGVGLSLTQET